MRRANAIVPVVGFLAGSTAPGQVSFSVLQRIVPQEPVFVYGVSADGSIFAGQSGYTNPFNMDEQPIAWNPLPQHLPDLFHTNPENARGNVLGISADGSVMVGQAMGGTSHYRAAKWTAGRIQALPVAPAVPFDGSVARAVSSDGTVTVGFSFKNGSTYRAHRWVGTTPSVVSGAPGYAYDMATGVSADGSEVVGFSFPNQLSSGYGVGWTWRGGQTSVLQTPTGGFGVSIRGLSGDGSTVFGQTNMGSVQTGEEWVATIWREGVPTMLPLPSGPYPEGFALAASHDGSTVVGHLSAGPLGPHTAFVWDDTHGMRSLSEILALNGVDLGGLTLREATGISTDGRTIVGNTRDSNNEWVAWVAVIPAPDILLVLQTCGLIACRRRRRLQ